MFLNIKSKIMIFADQPETIHVKLLMIHSNLMDFKVRAIVCNDPGVAMGKTMETNPRVSGWDERFLQLLTALNG